MNVLAELPFVSAESELFEEYVQNNLQPRFRKIFRNIAGNDAIKLWLIEKENIKKYLANNPGGVVIITDIWSSKGDDSYLCIAAHNIETKWVINEPIISFSKLERPHNGNYFGKIRWI